MSVELQWYYSSQPIDEDLHPLEITNSVSYSVTIRNVGDTTATDVGFYIKPSTIDPVAEIGTVKQSTYGVLNDWAHTIAIGDAATGGYYITQGSATTVVKTNIGDSAENPIALSIGSGTDGDELAPDEEVTITVMYVDTTPARRYLTLELTYGE